MSLPKAKARLNRSVFLLSFQVTRHLEQLMGTKGTSPGQSQHQNNHFVAQMGDVPPGAGESKGGTPRLHQLGVSQAQPRNITWGHGSENTWLFTLKEQHEDKVGPLFLIFLLTKVYLHPELHRRLWLGWGEMPVE